NWSRYPCTVSPDAGTKLRKMKSDTCSQPRKNREHSKDRDHRGQQRHHREQRGIRKRARGFEALVVAESVPQELRERLKPVAAQYLAEARKPSHAKRLVQSRGKGNATRQRVGIHTRPDSHSRSPLTRPSRSEHNDRPDG